MNYKNTIEEIANLTHEKFRKIYRDVNNGTRVKTTIDEVWIKKYGNNQADLAKLDYFELPNDWQKGRWFGAKVALDAVLDVVKNSKSLDKKFIEYVSNLVHEEWLNRNHNIAKNEHKLSYKQLSAELKEKDRIFVYSAIEIYNNRKHDQ
jgi:hypothetical protein